MLKAYKYRIYPNKIQTEKLVNTFGCVRFLWNKNVECWNSRDKSKTTTEYRKEFEFLKNVSAAAIQQKERDFLEYKKQRFSKTRKKFLGNPKFKTKRDRQSFRLPNQKFEVEFESRKIKLEKIGKIRIVIDRKFKGRPMSVTISRDRCNDYYASVLVEENIELKEKTNCVVGIDLGIRKLITSSDGMQVSNLFDNQKEISHMQRHLSRKVTGSNRFNKTKLKVAKLYRKEERRREWLLHNISSHMVSNYDVICMEDLNIEGMLGNHCLADKIGKASWSRLVEQVRYKSKFCGKELVLIDRWYPSSKTCSRCGEINKELKLSDSVFKCGSCGYVLDRDINASINIRSVGVDADKHSGMVCKTYSESDGIREAIPRELISFVRV